MICHFFLNDHLFIPCGTSEEGRSLLERVVAMSNAVLDSNQPLYAEGEWFTRVVVQPDVNVSALLRGDRELKGRLSRIVQQIKPVVMRADAASVYEFDHEKANYSVSDTIVAHAYEHVDDDNTASLLNLKHDYPGPELNVRKDADTPRMITSHRCKDDVVIRLQKLGLVKKYYSSTDNHTPNDNETILTDTDLFEPTKFGNRKNRLYRRIKKDPDDKGPEEWWCLDRLHKGGNAHLEVFRASDGQQIKVSRVDKIDFFRELTDSEKRRTWDKEKMP